MPEGPEVRLLCNKLCKILVFSKNYKLEYPGYTVGFDSEELKELKVIGKVLYFIFENLTLSCHFGLTGTWSEDKNKYTRATLSCDGKNLYFNDKINIGKLVTFPADLENPENLGPDILNELTFYDNPTEEQFETFKSCLSPNSMIATTIVDQKNISGIGNYIRSDALYLAKIHPQTKTKELNEKEILNLYRAINYVARKSFKEQGKGNYEYVIYQNPNAKKVKIGSQYVWY